MINKNSLLITISTVAVLGLLVSFFSNNKNNIQKSEIQNQEIDINENDQNQEVLDALEQVDSESHTDDEDHKHKKTDKTGGKIHKSTPKTFNFKAETAKLSKLQKDYPDSKRELLDMVLSKNRFSAAKAHSAAELAQRQEGALKVEALKTIFTLEKNKPQLREDLDSIAIRAEDPVIRKIANAALESLNNGRNFFDDAPKALENLPIPD